MGNKEGKSGFESFEVETRLLIDEVPENGMDTPGSEDKPASDGRQRLHRRASTLLHTETETRHMSNGDKMRMLSADESVPAHCWVRGLSEPLPPRSKHRPSMPPPLESLTLLPIGYRVGRYIHRERKAGRLPIFDLSLPLMQPPDPGPFAGVPLGGIGGGCIGRGFRGDFRRWNIWPGRYRSKAVLADQFSVRCRRLPPPAAAGSGGGGGNVQAAVLSVETADAVDPELQAWAWGMDPQCSTYAALYPRSWQFYDGPVEGLRLTCRQVSPVFPSEYRETSLPASVFEWTVENITETPMEVSLMFTFQNGTGLPADSEGGHSNRPFTAASAPAAAAAAAAAAAHGAADGSAPTAAAAAAAAAANNGLANIGGLRVRGVELSHCLRSWKVYDTDIEHEEPNKSCCKGGGGGGPGVMPKSLRTPYEDKLTFAVAAAAGGNVEVTACSHFATGYRQDRNGRSSSNNGRSNGRGSGGGNSASNASVGDGDALALSAREVWRSFVSEGALPERFDGGGGGEQWARGNGCEYPPHRGRPSAAGESIGAAVCQKTVVPARQTVRLVFCLAWDTPVARFGSGMCLPRRYTKFFGRGGDAAPALAAHALSAFREWEKRIDAWQTPILEDPHLPGFYKYTLFNELYFITDGGTVWLDSTDGAANPHDAAALAPLKCSAAQARADESCHGQQGIIGQFLYLEGHEYAMYNTYDVHFYASFALAMLWPMLQLSLQRDIALSVGRRDQCYRTLLGENDYRPRKVVGIVPHDLGSPAEEPYTKVNAYVFQDVSRWKDLGPKFVLQVYRDFVASGSRPFLHDMWPVVLHVMKFTEAFDIDGDGLIENQGFPDQTFDIWTVNGPSAYTGGLWVAAVSATKRMAETLREQETLEYYTELLVRAQQAYVTRLWNGKYFNYDSSDSKQSNSIMADQMAGQWYTRACGLEPVVDEAMARSSLRTVYENNVQRFGNGRMGAVNGMRPTGGVDNTCLQSREVWTGVTYACGAAMLHEAAVALEGLPQGGAATPGDPSVAGAALAPSPAVRGSAASSSGGASVVRGSAASSSAAGVGAGAGGHRFSLHGRKNPFDSMYKRGSGRLDGEERRLRQLEGQALRLAAFETIRGCHEAGWNDLGYWFQMPEGWEKTGNYRSLGYMRSLAIWAMQWAVEHESIILKNVYVKEEGVIFEETASDAGDLSAPESPGGGGREAADGAGAYEGVRENLKKAASSLLGRGATK